MITSGKTRPDLDTWLNEKPRTVTEIAGRIRETLAELVGIAPPSTGGDR